MFIVDSAWTCKYGQGSFIVVFCTAYQEGHDDTAPFIGLACETASSAFGRCQVACNVHPNSKCVFAL